MKKLLIYILPIVGFTACTNQQEAITSQTVHACCKQPSAKTAANILPDESLYTDADQFTDQMGHKVELKNFAGKVTITSMVFTHCTGACPRLTADIKSIADKLNAAGIKNVHYVLISFDTKRDTPEQLRQFAETMQMDSSWTLLHGNEQAVRQLSVLLNIQYEKEPDGSFSHSNVISVLDKQGRIATQLTGLGQENSEMVNKVKQLETL